jgi:hypothetical protein
MAEKFIGVEIFRNFSWNYRCEYCGKTVEQQDSMGYKVGQTVKKGLSATQYTLTDSGLAQFSAQARKEAPKVFDNTLKKWNDGEFPEWLKTKGKCPHCHKHQHWDDYYKHVSGDDYKPTPVGCMLSLFFFLVLPLLFIVIGIPLAKVLSWIIPDCRRSSRCSMCYNSWVAFVVRNKSSTPTTERMAGIGTERIYLSGFCSMGNGRGKYQNLGVILCAGS